MTPLDIQPARERARQAKFTPGRKLKTFLTTLLAAGASWQAAEATPVFHGISAANISVQQNDTSNNAVSVTLTTPIEINDFRVINNTQTSRADYFVQIGPVASSNVTGGILISSITDNGRDNGEGTGISVGTSAIDSNPSGSPGTSGQYWIPVFGSFDDTTFPEYNFDVAGAYFPYSNGWYGGWIVPANGANNSVGTIANDKLWSNTNMVLGTDVTVASGGRVIVNLLRFGLDSRSNAVLLCCGGKNEENFADSQPNTDGTWTVTCRDDISGGGEADPVAFVAVPITNQMIVCGRFFADGSKGLSSGPNSFSVITPTQSGKNGTYHLTLQKYKPGDGVLIISGEEGGGNNGDNIVSYQVNGDGWDIQTRDVGNTAEVPPLQSLPATDAVVSFAFIPAPTPGFTVTPTNGLATTENGGTAQFTVQLDAPPAAEVDVNLTSSDPTAGVPSPSSLAFDASNWNVPQTVIVTGLNNSSTAVESYKINFSAATSTDTNYAGIQAPSVSVVNVPNGQPGIFLVPTNGLVTAGAGTTASFQVLVNVQPTSDVTINFTSSNTNQGTISPSSVTFNSGNWTSPKVITISGVDDGIVDGDTAYQIIGSAVVSSDPNYTGLPSGTVSVLNQETDFAGVNFNVLGTIPVTEGGSTNFTVVLAKQPLANVTLNFSTDDPADGSVTPSVTFTPGNWNVAQSVTVNGLNNPAISGNPTWDILTTVSSTALGYSNLVVSNLVATTIKAVGLPSGTTVYGLGMPPVGVDGRATVDQGINFTGATFTFSITANADANDVLGVRNDGTGAGLIGVSGSTITYGGSSIATFTGGHGTPLVLTIQNGVSATAVQAMIEAVTFSATSTNDLATRNLQVTLNYGAGGASTVSKAVRVGQLRVTQYQDGADYGYGVYANETDIEISQAAPDTAYPTGSNPANGVFVQLNTSSSDHQVLIRFDNLVGTNAGQIPPGSIVVAADLNINILNSGDGFALNRMLISWDGTNSTWNAFRDQFGNNNVGIYADDLTAKATNYSQLGMFTVNGTTFSTTTTGAGYVSIGVTPDVQAWVNGETNFGWACDAEGVLDAFGNQPWLNLTDGTGFTPSEDPNVAIRPKLRVYWVPPTTPGTMFRYGLNGYTDVSDTDIQQSNPDNNYSGILEIFSDGNTPGHTDATHALIQFTNIVGSASNQIPANAHIEVAMLNLGSMNSSAAIGDGGRFFAMLQPWDATTTTWNSWSTNGILTDGVQAAVNPTVTAGSPTLAPNVQGGFHSFEVTPDVQNWANGALPNYGWAVIPWPNGSDGWGMDTSESASETNRPTLVVYYTLTPGGVTVAKPSLQPLVISPAQVQVKFTGTVGTTYTVSRSATLVGGWTVLGTAQIGGGGTGTYLDNSPLSGAAFYRVSYP